MLWALSLAMLVTLGDEPSSPTAHPADTVSPADIELARQVLDEEMINYPAARFRDVRAVNAPRGERTVISYCGLVNAPNRMGGLTGWVPFRLTPSAGAFLFNTSPGFNPRLHPDCVVDGDSTPINDTDLASALAPTQPTD